MLYNSVIYLLILVASKDDGLAAGYQWFGE